MALLFLDSFDHYLTADLTEKYTQLISSGGAAGTIGAYGRRSSQGYRTSATSTAPGDALGITLVPTGATCLVGFAFVQSAGAFTDLDANDTNAMTFANNATNVLIALRYLGVLQCWARVITDGKIEVLCGTTSLGTTANALSTGVTAYIELKILVHASAGTVNLNVNGVDWLTLTGQITKNASAAAALWDEVIFGKVARTTTTTISWDFDDLYIADGDTSNAANTFAAFVGDIRVDCRYPTEEGNSSAWTPSTGTDNSAVVDDTTPNDDTDYVSSAAASTKDTYVVQDAAVSGATVYGMQLVWSRKRSAAGTSTTRGVCRSGGSDFNGATVGDPTTYAYGRQCWSNDPADNGTISDTDFNAMQFGVEKVS